MRTKFVLPTVLALSINPINKEDEDLQTSATIRFIPMVADRHQNGQLQGVAAILDTYLKDDVWGAGVLTQVFIESNDPCPVGKDEDEWVAEVVHSVFTNVVSYLWSYSALALRTTLASMPVVSIEVPAEIHLEDSELIVSVAQATARE